MRCIYRSVLTLSLALVLTACGGDEEGPVVPDYTGSKYPLDFNELQQNPSFAPDMPPMPDRNDKEAMQKWTAEYIQKRMDRLKSGASQVTEAELERWYQTTKEFMASSGKNPRARAALIAKAGPGFAALSRKVSEALTGYSIRKSSGTLTEADKKVATLYDKYKQLMNQLDD